MTTNKSMPFAIIILLLAGLALPSSAQNASASHTTESSTSTDGKQVYRWRNSSNETDFNIEMQGKIELTDDDQDIKSISDDGYLEISKTVFGSKRSIRIESLGDGRVKKEYYEGRSQMPWEPNGKKWLSEILPEVVRSSTIGAENRTRRFFTKGGTAAVLNEIDRLENDHVRAYYGKLLMKEAVQPKDYPTIISRVTGNMDSDHYITDFLQNNAQKFVAHKESTTALFSAARRMDSDHFKTIVISEALKGNIQSPENIKVALEAASEMDSDHYITQVLNTLLEQDNLSDATLTELIHATHALESDHYRTIVLTNALKRKGLSDAAHGRLLESVKEMSSDHYITQVIMDLMVNKLSGNAMNDLLEILPSVDSDHYRTEIFRKLLDNQKLTTEQFRTVLEACGDMGSDHYKMIVLKDAIAVMGSNNALVQVLHSISQIESDHYATEVLLAAAPKVKSASAEIKNAYRQAAKGIESEHYYGRTLKAIED